jgi:PDZ domain-containing protein/peptidase S41-like protein
MRMKALLILAAGCASIVAAQPRGQDAASAPAAAEIARFRDDARSIERLVNANYAYLERFEGGAMPLSPRLRAEAETVHDRASLLRYAERALLALADHHAITGASFADSWAIVPSYADLWVERRGETYLIEAVRDESPAQRAGLRAGDRLVAVEGVAIAAAVGAFWDDLGLPVTPARAGFAARVLAAGRRDRPRRLTVQGPAGPPRAVALPNLYAAAPGDRPPLTAAGQAGALVIRLNDSLGDGATIAAFDAAMARARPGQRIVIDLRDTPGGGNTSVARAMMGWFVDRPRAYQVHNLPAEQRRTGIARQWIEQVLPRPGRHHRGPVEIRVGRWTGSMGEGLAIGFDALGARVTGTRMAGLLGAIYDFRLENSGLIVKLPAERLTHVNGTPREAFVPRE